MRAVLVVMDTTRADHLGCYGYRHPTSPSLDRLAREGVLFGNFYTTDAPTQPSFTSLLAGCRGLKTGIVSHRQAESVIPAHMRFFPEILSAKEITTAAVTSLYNFRPWFIRGFSYYMRPEYHKWVQAVNAAKVNEMAIEWLRGHADRDFFLFVHYWDPHTPYLDYPKKYWDMFYEGDDPCDPKHLPSLNVAKSANPYWEFKQKLFAQLGDGSRPVTDMNYVVARYDGEIRYTDDHIGELLGALEKLKIADDTLVMVTADHGEAHSEHECSIDHVSIYEEVAKVPCIIRRPGVERHGTRIGAMFQMVDLAPTILEYFGCEIPEFYDGRSLLPTLRGESEAGYEEVVSNQGLWSARRMIRRGRHKLIRNIDPGVWPVPPVELFDLETDPGETRDIASVETEIVDELELRLTRFVEGMTGVGPDPLRVAASTWLAWHGLGAVRDGRWRVRRPPTAPGLTSR